MYPYPILPCLNEYQHKFKAISKKKNEVYMAIDAGLHIATNQAQLGLF